MDKTIFNYLEKDYSELFEITKEFTNIVYTDSESAIIKGRKFGELLSKEILKLEKIDLDERANQVDRIKKLRDEELIEKEVVNDLHYLRSVGNLATHDKVETELVEALKIHKKLYDLTLWFLEVYTCDEFEKIPYKEPKPKSEMDTEILERLKKLETQGGTPEEKEIAVGVVAPKEKDKQCLVQELSRLKESSKEAVESLNTFSDFKKYMHIARDAQNELEDIIMEAHKKDGAQLVLVCGSVGDGKSHIISYFKD
ncbi:MAG: DUF4145 domain-containing protein, partial [Clostridium sp.]